MIGPILMVAFWIAAIGLFLTVIGFSQLFKIEGQSGKYIRVFWAAAIILLIGIKVTAPMLIIADRGKTPPPTAEERHQEFLARDDIVRW